MKLIPQIAESLPMTCIRKGLMGQWDHTLCCNECHEKVEEGEPLAQLVDENGQTMYACCSYVYMHPEEITDSTRITIAQVMEKLEVPV